MKNEKTRSRRERAQNTAGCSEGLSQSPAIDERERAELAARAGQEAHSRPLPIGGEDGRVGIGDWGLEVGDSRFQIIRDDALRRKDYNATKRL